MRQVVLRSARRPHRTPGPDIGAPRLNGPHRFSRDLRSVRRYSSTITRRPPRLRSSASLSAAWAWESRAAWPRWASRNGPDSADRARARLSIVAAWVASSWAASIASLALAGAMSFRPAMVSATTSGRSGLSNVEQAETVSRMILALKASLVVPAAAQASDLGDRDNAAAGARPGGGVGN